MNDKATCARCGTEKAAYAFDQDSSRANGRYPWCKLCRKKYSPARQQDIEAELNGHVCPLCDTPIRGHLNRRFCSAYCKERVASLKTKFALSVDQYRALVDATGGRCPICKCRTKKWAVDHNHDTGRVTGVVCTGCNIGLLAFSKHAPDLVESLLGYLQETPAEKLGCAVKVPDDPNGTRRGKSQLHKKWQSLG